MKSSKFSMASPERLWRSPAWSPRLRVLKFSQLNSKLSADRNTGHYPRSMTQDCGISMEHPQRKNHGRLQTLLMNSVFTYCFTSSTWGRNFEGSLLKERPSPVHVSGLISAGQCNDSYSIGPSRDKRNLVRNFIAQRTFNSYASITMSFHNILSTHENYLYYKVD